jgi:hypothetical protein
MMPCEALLLAEVADGCPWRRDARNGGMVDEDDEVRRSVDYLTLSRTWHGSMTSTRILVPDAGIAV